MPIAISNISPSLLPQPQHWGSEADVARYVYKCIDALDLDTWRFEWDKAISRLGCCKHMQHVVFLSIYFVRKYLELDQGQIRRTILHELAHALAWEHNRTSGHDATWHAFCNALGIGDEKARARCEDFAPEDHPSRRVRYVLYHRETGVVFDKFSRFPVRTFRRINQVYIKGRKAETLGKLGIGYYIEPGKIMAIAADCALMSRYGNA